MGGGSRVEVERGGISVILSTIKINVFGKYLDEFEILKYSSIINFIYFLDINIGDCYVSKLTFLK